MNFDPQSFLDATVNEANSTEIINLDEGEYTAQAGEVEIVSWQSKDGSKNGLKLVVPWEVLDDAAKAKTKRNKIVVRQDVMLDLTDNGTLDMSEGKNTNLGRLRDAVGLNRKGEPFNMRMLAGRTAKIRVGLREYEGRRFEEVRGVTKGGEWGNRTRGVG